MITFFTTFKKYSKTEKNAVNSWLSLDRSIEVIIFSEDNISNSWINSKRVSIIHTFNKHETGLPLLNSIFEEASRCSKFPILCYCNSDIILLPEFLKSISPLLECSGFFLGVSQRIDIAIEFEIDFQRDESIDQLRDIVCSMGKIHPPMGSDIFLHRRNQYTQTVMPNLLVGRPGWDNWMMYDARTRFNKLVDLTGNAPAVIHQDHPANYNSQNIDDRINFMFLPPNDLYTFILVYANYRITKRKLRKYLPTNANFERIQWELIFHKNSLLYYYYLLLAFRIKIKNKISTFYNACANRFSRL